MKKKAAWTLGSVWIVFLLFWLFNASMWAPTPDGTIKMIAHRGVYHQFDREGVGADTCTAARMLPDQDHEIFENTIHSIRAAVDAKADMVEVDVAPTRDGQMVLFHDWTVDCRTEGKGETRDLTLEELQALDIGYGYTADGGKTYPLRGKGVGKIPTVELALQAETFKPFLFNFKSRDPKEADQLFRIFQAAGRDPVAEGDSFYGAREPVDRMRKLAPGIWGWSPADVWGCTADYAWMGWFGIIPESCENATLTVPLNFQWLMAGWPNRTIARMESAGTRIVLFGPYERGSANSGLTEVRQLEKIPASYNGWVMVEDIRQIGPALVR